MSAKSAADTLLGQNKCWLPGIGLKLVPQIANIDPQVLPIAAAKRAIAGGFSARPKSLSVPQPDFLP
jgi:hypothetical protein